MNSDQRIFSAAVRRRYSLLANVAGLLAAVAPFALGLLALEVCAPTGSGPVAFIIVAVTLLAVPLLTWLVYNRLGLAGNVTLRRRLRARIAQEGHEFPGFVQPLFVGFAPGDRPLLWHGDTDRDIGFLAAWGDSLVYYGDEFSFTLPRDRIDIIEPIGLGLIGDRILIRWHAPRESNRAFTLVSREARDLRGAHHATHELLNQLYAWVARPPEGGVEAPQLGLPPTDTTGGTPADAAPGGLCAVLLTAMAATTVGAWQVATPLIAAGKYAHAVLATGAVFTLGFTLLGALQRLLQWAEERDEADRAATW